MRILALETVTHAGSLALWEHDACRSMVGDATQRHGQRLPGEITTWLETIGCRLASVDLLAVVTGPGSFTGLRVGIATMQGFAAAGHRRTVGVSALDALVAAYLKASHNSGLLAPCIDGNRGEVFYSLVDPGREGALDGWQTLVEPAAAAPDVAAAQLVAAAGGRPVIVVSPGANRHRATFEAAATTISVVELEGTTIAAGAAWLAAAHPERAGSPQALHPIYLRRSDAELALEREQGKAKSAQTRAWTLRRAGSPADLLAVEALQAASFASPWGAEAFRWELEHTDVARLYVLVDSDNRIFAYCACWVVLDELHINSLAVDAARRRQGAGGFLLEHLMAEAAGAGARAATLEVRASNRAAIQMYEKHGFRVEGTRRDYYQDPREDALVLWKRQI